jgi:hypothetical protein
MRERRRSFYRMLELAKKLHECEIEATNAEIGSLVYQPHRLTE